MAAYLKKACLTEAPVNGHHIKWIGTPKVRVKVNRRLPREFGARTHAVGNSMRRSTTIIVRISHFIVAESY